MDMITDNGLNLEIEEMMHIKQMARLTNYEIALRSGVPEATIQKILSGATVNPRRKTFEALQKTLLDYKAEMMVKEPYGEYNATSSAFDYSDNNEGEEYDIFEVFGLPYGPYTIKDYYKLPQDKRVELINGCFYNMAAPTDSHQKVVSEIHRQIANFIIENDGECVPCQSPEDVQLDCDDKTIVQPDLFIVCDWEEKKGDGKRIYGAPDFILEVLSPSTTIKDKTIKYAKYFHAGVKEYWIVDIKNKAVTVHYLSDPDAYDYNREIYTFEDKIPVNIYDGRLMIDFSAMPSYVKRTWDI